MYNIEYNLKQFMHNYLFIGTGIDEFESLLLRHSFYMPEIS